MNVPVAFLEDLLDKDEYFDEYVFCEDEEENQRIHRRIVSYLYPQDDV